MICHKNVVDVASLKKIIVSMIYANHVIGVCNCNIAIANLNKLGTLEGIRYILSLWRDRMSWYLVELWRSVLPLDCFGIFLSY